MTRFRHGYSAGKTPRAGMRKPPASVTRVRAVPPPPKLLPVRLECGRCYGSGRIWLVLTCYACAGVGWVWSA